MNKKLLILISLLLIAAFIFWYFRIYLSGVHHSSRFLGKMEIPCISSGYKIKLYQGNEQFESAQSLLFSLEDKKSRNIVDMKYFGGTSDFDRKDAQDFSIACKDSVAYIIFDKSDTMEVIDLRLLARN